MFSIVFEKNGENIIGANIFWPEKNSAKRFSFVPRDRDFIGQRGFDYILSNTKHIVVFDCRDLVRFNIRQGIKIYSVDILAFLVNENCFMSSQKSVSSFFIGEKVEDEKSLYATFDKIIKEFPENLWWWYEVEFFLRQESLNWGKIWINREKLFRVKNNIQKELIVLKEEILSKIPIEQFNPSLDSDVRKLAWDILKIIPPKFCKKSKLGYSVKKEILLYLSRGKYGEIFKLIISYKRKNKILNVFLKRLEKEFGLFKPKFFTFGAKTGRMSTSPNSQNFPRRIQEIFYPGDDKVFIAVDFSQIELRVLANSYDDKIIEELCFYHCDCGKVGRTEIALDYCPQCRRKRGKGFVIGKDFHRQNAEKFNLLDCENSRKIAKTLYFGMLYGKWEKNIATELNLSLSRTREICREIGGNGVKKFDYDIRKKLFSQWKIDYLFGGYRNFFPQRELFNQKLLQQKDIEKMVRMAKNSFCQGSAANIIKICLYNLIKYCPKIEIKNIIHDEIIIAIPKDRYIGYAKILRFIMEHSVKIKVPILTNMRVFGEKCNH